MQRINFIEIANLCFIFVYYKQSKFVYKELREIFSKNRILNLTQSFDDIIQICARLHLITLKNGLIEINEGGSKLGYIHKSLRPNIELKVKEYFIKEIIFNLRLNEYCAAAFINKFKVDTLRKTFTYERQDVDSFEETNWLINLHNLGLIEIEDNTVFVKHEYLEITNILLRNYRYKDEAIDDDQELRNKVGEFAELRAIDFEMDRLKKNGFEELSKLVQRISIVDKYAGYDILSFIGKGKFPEQNIFIEAKGTVDDKIKFIWTENERFVAKDLKNKYYIYSYWNVNLSSSTFSGPHIIKNPYTTLNEFEYSIEPTKLRIEKKDLNTN